MSSVSREDHDAVVDVLRSDVKYWQSLAEDAARTALQDPQQCTCMSSGGNIPESLQGLCVFHAILGRAEE